jgi:predicted Kef-type K+ transport protein
MHEIPLITTIALALSAALLFGLIARRLKLSPIVGCLTAGVGTLIDSAMKMPGRFGLIFNLRHLHSS